VKVVKTGGQGRHDLGAAGRLVRRLAPFARDVRARHRSLARSLHRYDAHIAEPRASTRCRRPHRAIIKSRSDYDWRGLVCLGQGLSSHADVQKGSKS